MRKMTEDVAKRFFGQVWDDFLGYFRIYEYIKLKAPKLSGKRVTVPSAASFWYSVLGDKFGKGDRPKYQKLRNGDILKVKDVFLTEWAPKLPGKSWTDDGVDDFAEARRHSNNVLRVNRRFYSVLPPDRKEQVVAAGYGSVRIARRTKNNDHFMYMSLVSKDHWHCDLGIPVVVSKQVYQQFYEHAENGAPWLRQVEGVLHINEDLPFKQLVPRSIGALLSEESEMSLRYRSGLPKCYLHVVSPLSVNPKYNDSHPLVTAWTQFETTVKRQPYRYTYTMFDPNQKNSINDAVDFINHYVDKYDGKLIITDFDGQQPRLEASLPLSTSTLRSTKVRHKVADLISGYNNWIAKEIERINEYW